MIVLISLVLALLASLEVATLLLSPLPAPGWWILTTCLSAGGLVWFSAFFLVAGIAKALKPKEPSK